MLKILHFSDAHIDMVHGQGRHDPASGLPVRVLDYLKALDTIVDTAIAEKVDLVLFGGDAYKDRTPAPTFQREWGRRMMRLSKAGIPTLLLVGNHDLPPAAGRASALQEFDTLQVPHIRLLSRPCLLGPADLWDLPLQVIALPWIARSGLMAAMQNDSLNSGKVYEKIEELLTEQMEKFMERLDPGLPTVLTAHASVEGALFGAERAVMLGNDLTLPGSMVRDPRLDYVALGHIHKKQDLNEGQHPPVVYPGSIERMDFGEAADDKFFVIAQVEKGKTVLDWRKLEGRRFIDRFLRLTADGEIPAPSVLQEKIEAALPAQDMLKDAIVRLVLEYPRDYDTLIDETAIRHYAEDAFEFHLIRKPQMEARLRLPENRTLASMSAQDLADTYWKTIKVKPEEAERLQILASEIISNAASRQNG